MPAIISFLVFLGVILLTQCLRVIKEYERGVVFRLGRCIGAKGPGLIILIPFVDQLIRVDLRIITMDVPAQDMITVDNVPVTVDAVVYFKVLDPVLSVLQVENHFRATSQIAQTTLRSILGQCELDELLSKRDKINCELRKVIDDHTDPWGVKVTLVEVKDVKLPSTMQRAMAKQAEAERERRAKVIAAEGEFQASVKLSEAAAILEQNPSAIQLRYLQTLSEIAVENNSTTIFPLPIELFSAFTKYRTGD